MSKRDEITVSKTDVLRYLENFGACYAAMDIVRSIPDSATAEDAWKAVTDADRCWLVAQLGGDPICCRSRMCGTPMQWCNNPDGRHERQRTLLLKKWPFSRVLAALVGDV